MRSASARCTISVSIPTLKEAAAISETIRHAGTVSEGGNSSYGAHPGRPTDKSRNGCCGHATDLISTPMINLPTRKTQTRAWLLAGLVAVLLRGLPDLRYPVGVDQALFCLIGQGLLRGQQLYRDLWDIKPPGIFYIYALIVKAFGPVAWCIGVVDVFWLLAISLCIFYFARRFVGAPAAALAMVFNVVRHCRQGYIHAAQPETFLMLCVFAAWFLLIPAGPGLVPALADASVGPTSLDGAGARRVTGWPFRSWAWADYLRVVVAGFALGAAFWLKYNAVLFFPVLMLVPFLDFREWDRGSSRVKMVVSWKDWLARVWFVGAGFALTVLAVLAYFWASGAWPAMRESQLEVLPRFAAGHFQWRLTQENLSFLVSALRSSQFHLGLWTEIMAPLSLLIAWGRRELRFLAPVFLLALAGYLCAAVQGQFNSYYFETCHPFFSMFWGTCASRLWKAFSMPGECSGNADGCWPVLCFGWCLRASPLPCFQKRACGLCSSMGSFVTGGEIQSSRTAPIGIRFHSKNCQRNTG